MPEKRGRYAKVLAEHLGGNVLEPVGDQERVFFVKVAIVKRQKEFAAVRIETLDRVRNPRREKPKVTHAHVIDEVAPLRVDGGYAGVAIKHVRPLGGLMPMQLAHAPAIEAHVHAGDILRHAEFARRYLTRPAARLEAHMGVRERET